MKTRIFLHPGMGKSEPHYLDQAGTIEDLARLRLTLSEGMTITFYDFDASEKSADGKLLFEGTVHFDTDQQKWYALIDWSSFRHEPDDASVES